MVQILRKLKSVESSYQKYLSVKGSLESLLDDKVRFDFCVDYMPGDGFIVLNVETSDVAPVDACISHIERFGVLSEQDHKQYCI